MESSGFNKERLTNLQKMGGTEFLSEMIEIFLDNAAIKIEAIISAADLEDARELELHSHALKSSAANLGANQLSELADKIEHAAMEGLTEPVMPIVTKLKSAYENVKKLLEHELENLKHE